MRGDARGHGRQDVPRATVKGVSIAVPGRRPRLAYLASEYPAPSHTFIRREVAALRNEGWTVDTLSIRPGLALTGQAGGEQTFVVLRQRAWEYPYAHLRWGFCHPLAYLAAAGLALRHRPPGVRGLFLSAAHFAEAGVVARQLERRKIGHLHNHFANSGATVGMIAAKLAGISWSFTMHGISETDYPAGLLLGRKIEAADCVVCASWFMRAQGLRAVAPEHWRKLHVIRCGIVPADLPQRAKRRKSGVSIVCVGRLSPEKGHAGLLEAIALLASSQPKLRLRLVGDGPYRQLLEVLAGELGIADRVQFLGALPEAATLAEIAQSDMLVLPSFLEGLPVVLMEAMALGVPVVASRIAGIPELVEHGRTGLLFTPSDWHDLADRILEFASDRELRSNIARRARELVVSEFDVRFAAARLSDLFASVDVVRPRSSTRGWTASFGMREAIIFSVIALVISVAVALSSGTLSSRPQPLARSTAPGER